MGADAIVDMEQERLPEFQGTMFRVTGKAVRAVDRQGQVEFRSRWYAKRIVRLSSLMLILLAVSLGGSMLGAAFFVPFSGGDLVVAPSVASALSL